MNDESTRQAARRPSKEGRAHASFRLVATEGPDAGKSFAVTPSKSGSLLVGQSAACDIRLSDPLVSRRHARLELTGTSLRIADLASTNGTFANEVAVIEASLWGGEILRIGGTTLRVELDDALAVEELADESSFGRLVGASAAMRRLYPYMAKLAASDLPLLVEGETGTGKELLAECLHDAGKRAGAPFVVFDSPVVRSGQSGQDIDVALFGDGSARTGIFEQAHGGTLVLDEVGELDADVQKRLLRVLERGEIPTSGGGAAARKVDVRVIATTRLDLDKLVADGAFREDLYYRLVVSRIELPPLRRRDGDVAILADHFWRALGAAGAPPPSVVARLSREALPGNVRELRNRIAQVVSFGDRLGEAGAAGRESKGSSDDAANKEGGAAFERALSLDLPLPRAREVVVAAFEGLYVERVLARHGGNVGQAAAASGLARRYFQILRARRGTKG